MQPRDDPYSGPGSFNPVMDRLDEIYKEARELRIRIEELVESRLAAAGIPRQEIEQKTEETAKLWLAA